MNSELRSTKSEEEKKLVWTSWVKINTLETEVMNKVCSPRMLVSAGGPYLTILPFVLVSHIEIGEFHCRNPPRILPQASLSPRCNIGIHPPIKSPGFNVNIFSLIVVIAWNAVHWKCYTIFQRVQGGNHGSRRTLSWKYRLLYRLLKALTVIKAVHIKAQAKVIDRKVAAKWGGDKNSTGPTVTNFEERGAMGLLKVADSPQIPWQKNDSQGNRQGPCNRARMKKRKNEITAGNRKRSIRTVLQRKMWQHAFCTALPGLGCSAFKLLRC